MSIFDLSRKARRRGLVPYEVDEAVWQAQEATLIGTRRDGYLQGLSLCRGALNWQGELARMELQRREQMENDQ